MSEIDDFESWFFDAIGDIHPPPDGGDYVALRSEAEDRWMEHRRTGRPLPTFGQPARRVGPPEDDDVDLPGDLVYADRHVDDAIAEIERGEDERERRRQAELVVERAEALPDNPSSALAFPAAWRELGCYLPQIDIVPTAGGDVVLFHASGEPTGPQVWEFTL